MDVRVISLRGGDGLLKRLRPLVPPSSELAVQRGVDVRHVETRALWEAGLVSETAAYTIDRHRKWHHELPSKGGVGCYQAMRLAISERDDRPLLLCEEDCRIDDAAGFREQLGHLLAHQDAFDVAVFGAQFFRRTRAGPSARFGDWKVLTPDDAFYLLHCVVYSPRGRRALSSLLLRSPQDMQIDGLYQRWSDYGRLRVLYCEGIASQYRHPTSIQERSGSCLLCDTSETGALLKTNLPWAAVGLTVGLIVCMCAGRSLGCRVR